MKTLRPRQICHHFANIFKCIFFNENAWNSLKMSQNFLKFEFFSNATALVHIMAWCWSGDKALSELVMVGLLMHICGTELNCSELHWPRKNWITDPPFEKKLISVWLDHLCVCRCSSYGVEWHRSESTSDLYSVRFTARSCEVSKLFQSLWNWTSPWAVAVPRCLSNFRTIWSL